MPASPMPLRHAAVRHVLAVLLAASSALALAQSAAPKADPAFQPSVGQPGKDVVWVPSPQLVVDRMLDLAKLTPRDFLMDLGSGDGRTVITAARRGARALGIEYNPNMVELSRRNAKQAGVEERAEFRQADIYATDFSQATVITMFLLPDINVKLRPKILRLKPGTRIVSNTFTMGDWQADESAELVGQPGCDSSWCTALFWIVPAQVSGTYRIPQGELTLAQEYQMLTGTLRTDTGKTMNIKGRVRGEEVSFTAEGREYRGKVAGTTLQMR